MKMKSTHSLLAFAGFMMIGIGPATSGAGEVRSTTPQEVFDRMRLNFRAEKARNLHVRYQFNLSGPTGGEWFIEVNDGKLRAGRGRIDNANVTFVASDKDWVALSNDTLNGTWAFLSGRLKIRGDHALAKKLNELFP